MEKDIINKTIEYIELTRDMAGRNPFNVIDIYAAAKQLARLCPMPNHFWHVGSVDNRLGEYEINIEER